MHIVNRVKIFSNTYYSRSGECIGLLNPNGQDGGWDQAAMLHVAMTAGVIVDHSYLPCQAPQLTALPAAPLMKWVRVFDCQ